MESIASRISLILTGAVLLAAVLLLCNSRLEYCGQPNALRPHSAAVSMGESQGPTLAPPQKVVFVQIETDKPDLEIGWLENQ
jgi:hypothetical protein